MGTTAMPHHAGRAVASSGRNRRARRLPNARRLHEKVTARHPPRAQVLHRLYSSQRGVAQGPIVAILSEAAHGEDAR
jgi:hypothetical protein